MFKKYSSIENSYRDAHIARIRREHPSVDQMSWVLTEKLHGSNVSFEARPKNDQVFVGRRKDYLATGEKFHGIWNYLKELDFENTWKPIMLELANSTNEVVRFYAEYIYGMKGIKYASDLAKIRFFDVMIGEEFIDQKNFFMTMTKDFHMPTVPIVAIRSGLEDAMAFDVDTYLTEFGPDPNPEDNFAEGVVGKPWKHVLRLASGSIVYFKKKHPKFSEVGQKKEKKEKVENPVVDKWREEFRTYVNMNRFETVISKEGPIKHRKQMGKYIKWMLDDAKKDFMKDNPEVHQNVHKGDIKQIFNLGGDPAHIVMRWMNENK
jgi:Rnl2 family RNA ligase